MNWNLLQTEDRTAGVGSLYSPHSVFYKLKRVSLVRCARHKRGEHHLWAARELPPVRSPGMSPITLTQTLLRTRLTDITPNAVKIFRIFQYEWFLCCEFNSLAFFSLAVQKDTWQQPEYWVQNKQVPIKLFWIYANIKKILIKAVERFYSHSIFIIDELHMSSRHAERAPKRGKWKLDVLHVSCEASTILRMEIDFFEAQKEMGEKNASIFMQNCIELF